MQSLKRQRRVWWKQSLMHMIHPTFGHIFKLCLPAKQQKYIVEFLHKRFKLRKLYAANLPKMPTRDAAMHLSFPCGWVQWGGRKEGNASESIFGPVTKNEERPPSFTPFLKVSSRLDHYFTPLFPKCSLRIQGNLGEKVQIDIKWTNDKNQEFGSTNVPIPTAPTNVQLEGPRHWFPTFRLRYKQAFPFFTSILHTSRISHAVPTPTLLWTVWQ